MSSRGNKVSLKAATQFLTNTVNINIQKDPYQQKYVEALIDDPSKTQAIFLDAEAGTGKTSIAISIGYFLLKNELIDQIIYIRSAVSIREMGFLPGDIAEKEAPYMQPGLDALAKVEKSNPKLIETLIANDQLVITTTAFLRGVDWSDRKFIIVDEAQNLNLQEIQTVLTRPHDTAKIIIIGSSIQCDEGPRAARYGQEKMLPFELYAYHFVNMTDLKVKQLKLINNYRGKFSLLADKITKTIEYLELPADKRSTKPQLVVPPTPIEENEILMEMSDKIFR